MVRDICISQQCLNIALASWCRLDEFLKLNFSFSVLVSKLDHLIDKLISDIIAQSFEQSNQVFSQNHALPVLVHEPEGLIKFLNLVLIQPQVFTITFFLNLREIAFLIILVTLRTILFLRILLLSLSIFKHIKDKYSYLLFVKLSASFVVQLLELFPEFFSFGIQAVWNIYVYQRWKIAQEISAFWFI